ncbi:MAG: hypothetical protein ACLQOO_05910 [Terriglobia bacterium]
MKKLVIKPEALVVNHLFEDSGFFLQEAKRLQGTDEHATRRYIRASIITAFAALEAILNTMLFLLDQGAELELAERAFVQEKRVELTEDGYFDVRGQKFPSLEEKIRFLYWRIEGVRIPKGNVVWESFVEAKRLRDELVHPKPPKVSYSKLTVRAAESCLKASSEIAQTLGYNYRAFR